MRTPRLYELALAFSLASCAPKDPEPAVAQNHTHEAVQRALEKPLSETDAIILEMEEALKALQAPPCEGPDGHRKTRLKEAIAKAQAHLAQKGDPVTIGDLNCDPGTLAVIVSVLGEKLKKSEDTSLAQNQ